MLAYEASDKIAAHIAAQVKGHKLYIYDSQTFASVQTYEAYVATVNAFEMGFRLIEQTPTSSWVAAAGAAQTVASTLGALRSTAEYAGETVNLQTDPLIAQVANHLEGSGSAVIVPKFVFIADDLKSSSVNDLRKSIDASPPISCADISRSIPDQLGCLLIVRNNAASVAVVKTAPASQAAAFAELDKLFQVFFGTLMGTSVNLSSSTTPPTSGTAPGGGGAPPGGGNASSPTATTPAGNTPTGNQSASVPLLSQIIQGHRLEAKFKDTNSRVLVIEATEAGGGSRIKHIFFVELFWTTPTPTFTGGSIVTYLLINPATSEVEKSEVLRFTVDYCKFHGKKIETPSNF
jgi:hypothetical protein